MKFLHVLFITGLMIEGLASCDNLTLDERLDGPIQTVTSKNVLIEDFTGQKCSNCPLAHEELEKLQTTYGREKVIAVAIHGGAQAVDDTNPAIVGLANEQGKEYNRRLGSFSYPKGVIDRQGGLADFEKWNAAVVARAALHSKVSLTIEDVAVDTDARQITVDCSVEGMDEAEGRLQLWLTENNILAPQALPGVWGGGVKTDYVHHHVFRAAINGLDGELIHLEQNQREKKHYVFALDKKWQIENLSLVMIYYNDTEGVMQVIDMKLKDNK